MKAGKYIFIYIFTYMAIGSFCPLIGKYLEAEGFSGSGIGIITAAGTMTAIFASIFWGKVYVNARRRKRVPALLSLGASVLCLVLMEMESFGGCLAVYALMYFFQAPILALVDAMCVEECKGFGMARMWGAVGYALGVLVSGRLAAYMSLSVIFDIYAASYVLAGVFILAGRREAKKARSGRIERNTEKTGYMVLAGNRRYVKLIAAVFFFGGTNVANNTYFSFMYMDCGGTIAGVGVAMFLMIAAEAPFMAAAEAFSARFTMERMILVAMIVSTIRFAIYGAGVHPVIITSIFFLQGFVNGIALVEIIRYIAKITEPEVTALATSAYYAIGSNLSTIICQLAGGMILQEAGGCGVYMFFAAYNLIGVMIYVISGLHRPDRSIYEIV